MTVLLEWGPTAAAAALAARCDVAVVVDVPTFSTPATVAADRGVSVVPHRHRPIPSARKTHDPAHRVRP